MNSEVADQSGGYPTLPGAMLASVSFTANPLSWPHPLRESARIALGRHILQIEAHGAAVLDAVTAERSQSEDRS